MCPNLSDCPLAVVCLADTLGNFIPHKSQFLDNLSNGLFETTVAIRVDYFDADFGRR